MLKPKGRNLVIKALVLGIRCLLQTIKRFPQAINMIKVQGITKLDGWYMYTVSFKSPWRNVFGTSN